ncbi:hypothetical protein F5Y06DRAFT_307538 [Hypoxylon sp. FL0890]|nr:hypothetical protein F5Y06DRAFT_307538 [Hypoxylon sp. FL0890]
MEGCGGFIPYSRGSEDISEFAWSSIAQIPIRSQYQLQDMEAGDKSEKGLLFCPWKLIRLYPYSHVGKENEGDVAELMKTMLFLGRAWDFFYLLDPGENGRDPLLLVPSGQFEEFLDDMNSHLVIKLSIPTGQACEKFYVTFGDGDTPRPRFLGSADSDEALEALKIRIHRLPIDDLKGLSATTLKGYKDKMDEVYNSCKSGKNKKDPEAAKMRRIERQKGCGRMIKRTQRYLGLRNLAAFNFNFSSSVRGWHVNMPAPFRTKDSVRFVCIDIEAWERGMHDVTEVGLAVLDTADTVGIPPGTDGRDWFPLMRSYHFRIREHIDKVNRRYVHGCPHLFNFGNSEFVRSQDICRVIGTIIGDHQSKDKRPVIMVGHDISQDLDYLLKVGFNIWHVPHFTDEIDTKSMFQRLEKSSNGRGLATLCDELGIPGRNFHNAGNDATYTLRAMIVMAVKQMVQNPVRQANGAREPENDEWSDGSIDDGGPPLVSLEPVPRPPQGPASKTRKPVW